MKNNHYIFSYTAKTSTGEEARGHFFGHIPALTRQSIKDIIKEQCEILEKDNIHVLPERLVIIFIHKLDE